jgi:hypothetical protein
MESGKRTYGNQLAASGPIDYTSLFTSMQQMWLHTGTFNEQGLWTIPGLAEKADEAKEEGKNFGKATFKIKKDQVWEEFEVVLREDVGAIVAGDQWIVKFDEDFTRIVTPQLKLSKDSQYRIYDVE